MPINVVASAEAAAEEKDALKTLSVERPIPSMLRRIEGHARWKLLTPLEPVPKRLFQPL
jgi:hypothetical protein